MKKLLVFFCIVLNCAVFAKPSSDTPKRKTICLNMIVKDEKDVIEKCLASVKPIIDYWVIYDTGSTDGTQAVIKKFMKDIPGELHESKWVDFAYNRNEALAKAKSKADYILLIDADEILQFSPNFTLPNLVEDRYTMTVRQLEGGDARRTAMINTQLDWKWQGVIHETLECPQQKTEAHLKDVMNICNASLGARSKIPTAQKYLKDAEVLEKALIKEPDNSRYVFYLGVSYLAGENYDLAIKAFEKRVNMASNDLHETYMAKYNLGLSQDKGNDFNSALKSYFKAYEFHPVRAEPLFRAATICRKQENLLLGYLISKYALTIPYPADDLCVEYMVYDYTLLVEFANCALLCGKYEEGLQACMKLLANPNLPPAIKGQVVSNAEVARKQLSPVVSIPQ